MKPTLSTTPTPPQIAAEEQPFYVGEAHFDAEVTPKAFHFFTQAAGEGIDLFVDAAKVSIRTHLDVLDHRIVTPGPLLRSQIKLQALGQNLLTLGALALTPQGTLRALMPEMSPLFKTPGLEFLNLDVEDRRALDLHHRVQGGFHKDLGKIPAVFLEEGQLPKLYPIEDFAERFQAWREKLPPSDGSALPKFLAKVLLDEKLQPITFPEELFDHGQVSLDLVDLHLPKILSLAESHTQFSVSSEGGFLNLESQDLEITLDPMRYPFGTLNDGLILGKIEAAWDIAHRQATVKLDLDFSAELEIFGATWTLDARLQGGFDLVRGLKGYTLLPGSLDLQIPQLKLQRVGANPASDLAISLRDAGGEKLQLAVKGSLGNGLKASVDWQLKSPIPKQNLAFDLFSVPTPFYDWAGFSRGLKAESSLLWRGSQDYKLDWTLELQRDEHGGSLEGKPKLAQLKFPGLHLDEIPSEFSLKWQKNSDQSFDAKAELHVAANRKGSARGWVRGPVQLDLKAPKIHWNPSTTDLSVRDFEAGFSALGVELPKALKRLQDVERETLKKQGQKLPPKITGLGIDARFVGDFDFNLKSGKGEGKLTLQGDQSGDIYFHPALTRGPDGSLSLDETKIPSPLFSQTRWQASRIDRVELAQGSAFGKFRLATQSRTDSLKAFGFTVNHPVEFVLGHRDLVLKPGGIENANRAYYKKILRDFAKSQGLNGLVALYEREIAAAKKASKPVENPPAETAFEVATKPLSFEEMTSPHPGGALYQRFADKKYPKKPETPAEICRDLPLNAAGRLKLKQAVEKLREADRVAKRFDWSELVAQVVGDIESFDLDIHNIPFNRNIVGNAKENPGYETWKQLENQWAGKKLRRLRKKHFNIEGTDEKSKVAKLDPKSMRYSEYNNKDKDVPLSVIIGPGASARAHFEIRPIEGRRQSILNRAVLDYVDDKNSINDAVLNLLPGPLAPYSMDCFTAVTTPEIGYNKDFTDHRGKNVKEISKEGNRRSNRLNNFVCRLPNGELGTDFNAKVPAPETKAGREPHWNFYFKPDYIRPIRDGLLEALTNRHLGSLWLWANNPTMGITDPDYFAGFNIPHNTWPRYPDQLVRFFSPLTDSRIAPCLKQSSNFLNPNKETLDENGLRVEKPKEDNRESVVDFFGTNFVKDLKRVLATPTNQFVQADWKFKIWRAKDATLPTTRPEKLGVRPGDTLNLPWGSLKIAEDAALDALQGHGVYQISRFEVQENGRTETRVRLNFPLNLSGFHLRDLDFNFFGKKLKVGAFDLGSVQGNFSMVQVKDAKSGELSFRPDWENSKLWLKGLHVQDFDWNSEILLRGSHTIREAWIEQREEDGKKVAVLTFEGDLGEAVLRNPAWGDAVLQFQNPQNPSNTVGGTIRVARGEKNGLGLELHVPYTGFSLQNSEKIKMVEGASSFQNASIKIQDGEMSIAGDLNLNIAVAHGVSTDVLRWQSFTVVPHLEDVYVRGSALLKYSKKGFLLRKKDEGAAPLQAGFRLTSKAAKDGEPGWQSEFRHTPNFDEAFLAEHPEYRAVATRVIVDDAQVEMEGLHEVEYGSQTIQPGVKRGKILYAELDPITIHHIRGRTPLNVEGGLAGGIWINTLLWGWLPGIFPYFGYADSELKPEQLAKTTPQKPDIHKLVAHLPQEVQAKLWDAKMADFSNFVRIGGISIGEDPRQAGTSLTRIDDINLYVHESGNYSQFSALGIPLVELRQSFDAEGKPRMQPSFGDTPIYDHTMLRNPIRGYKPFELKPIGGATYRAPEARKTRALRKDAL